MTKLFWEQNHGRLRANLGDGRFLQLKFVLDESLLLHSVYELRTMKDATSMAGTFIADSTTDEGRKIIAGILPIDEWVPFHDGWPVDAEDAHTHPAALPAAMCLRAMMDAHGRCEERNRVVTAANIADGMDEEYADDQLLTATAQGYWLWSQWLIGLLAV